MDDESKFNSMNEQHHNVQKWEGERRVRDRLKTHTKCRLCSFSVLSNCIDICDFYPKQHEIMDNERLSK